MGNWFSPVSACVQRLVPVSWARTEWIARGVLQSPTFPRLPNQLANVSVTQRVAAELVFSFSFHEKGFQKNKKEYHPKGKATARLVNLGYGERSAFLCTEIVVSLCPNVCDCCQNFFPVSHFPHRLNVPIVSDFCVSYEMHL